MINVRALMENKIHLHTKSYSALSNIFTCKQAASCKTLST